MPTDQQRVASAERAGGRIDVRWSEPPCDTPSLHPLLPDSLFIIL
jgi:hypothetical protein